MNRTSTTGPTSLRDPALWLLETFGGTESTSGVRVNQKSALGYSPWWKGVSLISGDVAKLPLMVHKREGEGKARATEHPAFRLLRRRPNPYMTAFVFLQTLTAHVVTRGNGYAFIDRNESDATPLALLPLSPDDCYPLRENGRLWYAVKVGSEWVKEQPENVLHIKGLGYDGLVGYDVVQFVSPH